jgi:PelA/Pel-15E family pectate lyase
MTAVLTEAQRAKVLATRHLADTSFDNGNVHSQVAYLARAVAQTGEPAWRDACLRGLDFMLSAQYPNGGFPQRYPKPTVYHAHITFNDGAMIGCLNVLEDAADGSAHFTWLDDSRRARAQAAVERGVACILQCQIRVNGRLTGWCQQHDEKTYEPRPARTFELASICPQDTTEIVRFLMRLENPNASAVQAMDAAVVWLTKVKLSGIRVENIKAPPAEFLRHTADFDKVVVNDPNAPPLWARHYEIGTNRPIFAGRDGVKKYALAEIERERRTGTAWYGNWPRKLIETDYPKWRREFGAATK